jgi:hypothetical protein
MPLTTVDQGLLSTNAQYTGFKNRIINGDMVIDQRNAGAVVTPANGVNTFIIDRWAIAVNQSSKLTSQQSTVAPTGFTNSLLVTSSSAYSLISTDLFCITQKIEGFNTADFAWGTANAQPVTVSFKVRCSITGTFGGVIRNGGSNRFYPFTYTINSANTFEDKTVTIAGDTTGTWLTNNGTGLELIFSLGVGSSYLQPAGAWTGGFALSAVGTASLVGTNGATFYITGVQVEKGQTATSFDVLPYTTELLLCQRYFVKFGGEVSAEAVAPSGIGAGTTSGQFYNLYPVRMRTQPTVSYNALNLADTVNPAVAVTSIAFGTTVGSSQISSVTMSVASGVAANRPLYARTADTTGFLAYSAEL